MCVSEMTCLGEACGENIVANLLRLRSLVVFTLRCWLAGWRLTSLPLHNLFMAKYQPKNKR
jgi:hypothetical protein